MISISNYLVNLIDKFIVYDKKEVLGKEHKMAKVSKTSKVNFVSDSPFRDGKALIVNMRQLAKALSVKVSDFEIDDLFVLNVNGSDVIFRVNRKGTNFQAITTTIPSSIKTLPTVGNPVALRVKNMSRLVRG